MTLAPKGFSADWQTEIATMIAPAFPCCHGALANPRAQLAAKEQ
jgi:hypothetical protein